MKGTGLAEAFLPTFQAGSDIWRWEASNAHGEQMRRAVADLRSVLPDLDPAEVLDVLQRAIDASIAVLRRASGSSGQIGDAVEDLLRLHAEVATRARPAPAELVDWLIAFQLDGRQHLFEVDPVAYATALGEEGMRLYRSRLAAFQEHPFRHQRFALEHNAQRLAVLDRDVEAIIATHLRTGRVAAWSEETARALEEIGESDLAIEWADRAAHHDLGPHAQAAADYWCALLGEHRAEALAEARLDVFRRWPSAASAAKLAAASDEWPELGPEVLDALRSVPREAVLFALMTDPHEALELYDELGVRDGDVTAELAEALEPIDVGLALPLHRDLIERQLAHADALVYRPVAERLARMRRVAEGTPFATRVDEFIAELRAKYPNRPRMRAEFDQAQLP